MISWPKAVAIFHNVAMVKLWVPESQRLTSFSLLPMRQAKSRWDISLA